MILNRTYGRDCEICVSVTTPLYHLRLCDESCVYGLTETNNCGSVNLLVLSICILLSISSLLLSASRILQHTKEKKSQISKVCFLV